MRNKIFAYFDMNSSKAFPVIYGMTYTETFNEEIDSANIVLDNISEADRLYFDRPYHFVKLVNEANDLTLEEYAEEYPETEFENRIVNHVVTYNHDIEVGDRLSLQMSDRNFNYPLHSRMTFTEYALINGIDYIIKATVRRVREPTGHEQYGTVNYVVDSIREANYEQGIQWNGKNYKFMLVDTFVETLNNLGEEKIYKYQIQLMNCVKILEKIQCPSLMITHSLNINDNYSEGHKTIYDYINQYMLLYSPKIKLSTDGENWSYDYLLDWSGLNVEPFNNTIVADMQMSEPTLRQLITNLMLQVGCIPKIEYRTVTFINYREEESQVVVANDDGINFIRHSGASDSYVNNLMQSPTQTLENQNEVLADIVGFRDSSNALIKQRENLQIETRYPIYKINRVLLRGTDNAYGWIVPQNENGDFGNRYCPKIFSINSTDPSYVDKNISIKCFGYDSYRDETDYRLSMNFIYLYNEEYLHSTDILISKVFFTKYNPNTQEYDLVQELSLNKFARLNVPETIDQDKGYDITNSDIPVEDNTKIISMSGFKTITYHYETNFTFPGDNESNLLSEVTHVFVRASFTDLTNDESQSIFIPMSPIKLINTSDPYYDPIYMVNTKFNITENNSQLSFDTLYPSNETPMEKLLIPANIGAYVDITPLVIENHKRSLLDTDYTAMQTDFFLPTSNYNNDLYALAKYIYGTMGYTIGDNKITGFSETYSRAQMWWKLESSYFDVILNFIQARKNHLVQPNFTEILVSYRQQIAEYYQKCGYGIFVSASEENFYINYDASNWISPSYSKMKFLFYIYYQPLNNFKIALSKEGKNNVFSIEQLNQSSDGLNDYTRLTKNIQDTVNRIGNPIKAIPQTTDDINKIKPLNGIYNDGHYDFTIFKREISIYENYVSCLYSASENYVIKNYFTSIITKYRAYQYVDYNEAIVRKDNIKFYCMLSDKHYYDGTNRFILNSGYYSLANLVEILNVPESDIMQYINFVDNDSNTLKYVNTISLLYGIFATTDAQDLSGAVGHSTTGILSSNSFSTDGTNAFNEEVERVSQHADFYMLYNVYNYFTWAELFYSGIHVTPEIVMDTVKNFILQNDGYNNLINFINNNFSNILSNRTVFESSYLALRKMDNSYMQIGTNYYLIHIKEIDNDFLDYILDQHFSKDKYNYLSNIFTTTLNYLSGMAMKNYSSISANGTVESLKFSYKTISIYLEQIDQPSQQVDKTKIFLSGLTSYDTTYDSFNLKYAIESSYNKFNLYEEVKNECSVLVNSNGFAVYYQDFDNVSAGPYLTSLDLTTNVMTGATGGYVQKWQVWNQDIYGVSHRISFAYNLVLKQSSSETTINEYISQLPVINKGWEYQPYNVFSVVDNNKGADDKLTFYKDNAEIINQTIQFEYYSNENDIIWSNNFINHCQLINRFAFDDDVNLPLDVKDFFVTFDITDRPFKVRNDIYDNRRRPGYEPIPTVGMSPAFAVDYDSDLKLPYVLVKWGEMRSDVEQILITVCNYDSTAIGYNNVRDMMAFKRNGRTENTRYYLSLNDTKTNDVWYFKSDEDLFETYECDNGLGRYCHEPGTVLTSMVMSGLPKSTFVLNEPFSFGSAIMRATFTSPDGHTYTQNVNDRCIINGYDNTTAGNQTITVKYEFEGIIKTVTYDITVVALLPPVLSNINATATSLSFSVQNPNAFATNLCYGTTSFATISANTTQTVTITSSDADWSLFSSVVEDYMNHQLLADVEIRFERDSQYSSEVVLLQENFELIAPVISGQWFDVDTGTYGFDVTNNNNVACRLEIGYSDHDSNVWGSVNITVPANSTYLANAGNIEDGHDRYDIGMYFYDYFEQGGLADSLYCHFIATVGGVDYQSQDEYILEEY